MGEVFEYVLYTEFEHLKFHTDCYCKYISMKKNCLEEYYPKKERGHWWYTLKQ